MAEIAPGFRSGSWMDTATMQAIETGEQLLDRSYRDLDQGHVGTILSRLLGDLDLETRYGCLVNGLTRAQVELPISRYMILERGDVLGRRLLRRADLAAGRVAAGVAGEVGGE